jgi:Fe(3+) dicitrate transport protein
VTTLAGPARAQEPGPFPAPVAPQSVSEPAPVPTQPATDAVPPGEPVPEAAPSSPPAPPPSVDVVARPIRRTPGSVYVVSQKTLERYQYTDPHQVMKLVPGVYVRQEDGVGLRPNIGIRGGQSDRSKKVTLMEDGVLFGPAPYSAPAAYYFPLMPRITQVRVLKGPAAIAFGPQTIGGAIDLVTRAIPSKTAGSMDLTIGDYGYAMLHGWAGTSTETTGVVVEGIHMQSDGFKELPSGADTGFARNEWMVKGSHNFAPNSELTHELGVKLSYATEISNETYLGLADADFRKNPNARYGVSALDRMRWTRSGLSATHTIEPAKNLKITTTIYRNDFFRVWRKANQFKDGTSLFDTLNDPEGHADYYAILAGRSDTQDADHTLMIGPNQRDFVSQGIQTRSELELTTGDFTHRMQYGLRYHNDSIARRHTQDGFLVFSGQLVPDDVKTQTTAFNEGITNAVALHATDAVTWGGLTVTPGIRLELIQSTYQDRIAGSKIGSAHQIVLPGLGAFYAFTDAFGILAGVHRGMSPPIPESGASGRPELSVNYEAGVRYWKGPFRAEAVGYYEDYSNLTTTCDFQRGCSNKNLDRQLDAGKARIYGVELFVEHEVPITEALRLPVRGSYTYTHAEFLESFRSEDPAFGNVQAGYLLPYVPMHQAFVSVGLESDRAGGYVAADYVGRMREEAGNKPFDETLATDAQFLMDTGAFWKPFKFLRLFANVRNVFNEQYIVSRRPYGARPNAPLWMQVGAKVDF